MGHIQIKNVPEAVHEELRLRAEQGRSTIRDYVLGLIEEDQARPTMKDWLDEVAAAEPVELSESAAESVRAARQEREDQLDEVLYENEARRRAADSR